MNRLLGVLVALAVVVCAQGCSTTVLTAECANPKVSNSSVPFVYLVMLPYAYRGKEEPSVLHQVAAVSLNDVAGLQVVRMGAETTDMHVTLLRDSGKGCDIEEVYKVFTEKHFFERELRSTVVFYWGEIFEVDDRMIVQSHIRMLWKNPEESLVNVDVTLPSDRSRLRFTGFVPYATVSFPPRTLPVENEEGSGLRLRMSLEAHSAPTMQADKVPLPKRFIISRREGDWVELRDASTHTTSWIAVTDRGANAKSLLPELSFAHALAAYASFSRVPNNAIASDSIRWLDEFRAGYGTQGASEALRQPNAVADAVEAVLRMNENRGEQDRRRVVELMDRAVGALPTSSAVLNLSAISRIEQCCSTREAASEIQRGLELARQLDAGNEMVAQNLLNWYRLLAEKDASVWPGTKEEIRRRAAELAEALR